jgi:hypothetical protein
LAARDSASSSTASAVFIGRYGSWRWKRSERHKAQHNRDQRHIRRSVLPENFGEISDSSYDEADKKIPTEVQAEENSDDSEMMNGEHFEEEELPEHSNYSNRSENEENGAEHECGELELDDSDEASSGQSAQDFFSLIRRILRSKFIEARQIYEEIVCHCCHFNITQNSKLFQHSLASLNILLLIV